MDGGSSGSGSAHGGGHGVSSSSVTPVTTTTVPVGVAAIYQACKNIYKDQPNPLQVTTVKKYWADGPDPLDHISMYANCGDSSRSIPPHWHYVSMGLSDLHGDGRVHERNALDGLSGFGFELTFRLKCEHGETAPPTWPATLMQSLAKYVFQSENILQAGDHVSWHTPLDQTESRIQHMLMAEDTQLSPITTPLGTVNFIQIVGVCSEELKAAQHWNGPGVLELLRSISLAGGPWLITNMRRGETIFELDAEFQEKLDQGIEQDGSNLSGVSGIIMWEEQRCSRDYDDDKENSVLRRRNSSESQAEAPKISDTDSEQIKDMLKKGLVKSSHEPSSTLEASGERRNESRKASFDSNVEDHPSELVRTRTLDGLHLRFNAETGSLLPLAFRGRLKHGRHFTFKSTINDIAVTFVSPDVAGALVDSEHPYATHGHWLQVRFEEEFIEQLSEELDILSNISEVVLPKVMSWPAQKLTFTVLPEVLPPGITPTR